MAGNVALINLNQIEANPFQPRTEFDESALKELAESIQTQGIIQPITVRKMGPDKYQDYIRRTSLQSFQIGGINFHSGLC